MSQLNNIDKNIRKSIESKRFNRRVYSKNLKKEKRRAEAEKNYNKKRKKRDFLENTFGVNYTYLDIADKWLPTNLLYVLKCSKTNFNLTSLQKEKIFRQDKPVIKK